MSARGAPTGFAASLLLALLALAGGCSSETGIVVAVSSQHNLDKLLFHVGVAAGEQFVLDETVSGQQVVVTDRKLRNSPYELLLREPTEEGAPLRLRVLVLGIRTNEDGDRWFNYDFTEKPQPFIRGEVVRRALNLRWIDHEDPPVTQEAGCFVLTFTRRVDDEDVKVVYRLVPDDDRDCDGAPDA